MIYIYRHILNDYVVMRRGKRIALGIEPLEIEKWLQALRREKGLANPTLDKTRRVMSLVYKHSQRHGLIPRGEECNPLRFVRCKSTSDYEAIILTSGQAFSMLLCLSERLTNYGSHPEWPTTSSHNLCATVEEWAFRPAFAQENIECRPEGGSSTLLFHTTKLVPGQKGFCVSTAPLLALEFPHVITCKFPLWFSMVLAVLLFSAMLLPAQMQSPKAGPRGTSVSAYKLIEMKVTGTKRYTPDQMIGASGLRLGENVSEQNFKDAVQKLGDTGMFTDVAYTYSFSPAGTKVEFQLADNDKLVPAEFDNFVWFTDQELVQKIRSYVPLFRGELPLGGDLTDKVADALQAVLAERGVNRAQVDIRRPGEGGTEAGTVDRVIYSISGAALRIRNFEFPGASAVELPLLARAAQREQGDQYQRSKLRMFAGFDLRPIYLREGKLRINFGEPQAKVVHETPDEILLDVMLPVEEGREYKLSQIEWSGNTLFPTAQLAKMIHQQPGQPVNAVQLKDDLDNIKPLYKARGYMKATVEPHLDLNDAAGTASYKLEVKEGDLYRMGEIEIEGLDDKTTARLREAWTLRQGAPYDSSYAKRFLKETGDLLPPSIKWGVTIHEDLNEKEKGVDVTLRFKPKGAT